MQTSRRRFLQASGAASAGLMIDPRVAFATGRLDRPAPQVAPESSPQTDELLAKSRLLKDEALGRFALDRALKAGATYADVRLVLWRRETISTRDDHIEKVSRSDEYGIGIRVIHRGAWGFSGTYRVERGAIEDTVDRALASATANAPLRSQPVSWAPAPVVKGRWVSPFEVDPFNVSLQEKSQLLIGANKSVLAQPSVAYASSSVRALSEEKLYLNSEGSRTHQLCYRMAPQFSATALDRKRGGFASMTHDAPPLLGGWEHARDAGFEQGAPQLGIQAVQKLHAASVVPGKRNVVIAPSNLWLTIHETIGHPTELDRALGYEANFAGTSFITPKDTGRLQLGSPIVNLVADRTQPGGLATTAWDDDGVAAQRWDIVRGGAFVGWQTTRDQAQWIGESQSRGCSYGDGYSSVAFQRMPNISLQPGLEGYTTEDLINATEDGIYIDGRGSWSIDHQRYNFQFGGQFFWEIKNGRLTRPLRDVAYQANSLEFWRSCDMIGGKGTYRLGSSLYDGKGEPSQINGVSHGCPPARFWVNVVNTGNNK